MWLQRWGIVDVGQGRALRDVVQINAAAEKDSRRNAINNAGAVSNNAISTTSVVVVVNAECGPPCGTKNRHGSGVEVCWHACEARRLVSIERIDRVCLPERRPAHTATGGAEETHQRRYMTFRVPNNTAGMVAVGVAERMAQPFPSSNIEGMTSGDRIVGGGGRQGARSAVDCLWLRIAAGVVEA